MTGVWLGIETTSAEGGIALVRGKEIIREERFSVMAFHSEKVLPCIDRIMQISGLTKADIAGIAVSTGPGSYTGVRIGIATAMGLSAGWDKPVVGIETLRVLSAECASSEPVLICVRARKKEVYGAVFESSEIASRELLTSGIYTSEAIEQAVKKYLPVIAVGTGRSELERCYSLKWLPESRDTPSSSRVAFLGAAMVGKQGSSKIVKACYLRNFMEKAKGCVR